jgi:hypothetical protein
MHTLHITAVVRDQFVAAARAVQKAYDRIAELEEDASVRLTLREAGEIVEEAGENPPKLIYASDHHEHVITARRTFDDWRHVIEVKTDLDIEDFRRVAMGKPKRTPEEVFSGTAAVAIEAEPDEIEVFSTQAYETALAMMAMCEGHPLRVAANAHALGRTTGDDDFYGEVILAMVSTFPWLEESLRSNGIMPDRG